MPANATSYMRRKPVGFASVLIGVGTGAGVSVGAFVYWFYAKDAPDLQTMASLGDSFAPLAFTALVVTIFLQLHSVGLQRQDLAIAREDKDNNARALDAQISIHPGS